MTHIAHTSVFVRTNHLCISAKTLISQPKLSLNYHNQTRVFHVRAFLTHEKAMASPLLAPEQLTTTTIAAGHHVAVELPPKPVPTKANPQNRFLLDPGQRDCL